MKNAPKVLVSSSSYKFSSFKIDIRGKITIIRGEAKFATPRKKNLLLRREKIVL